MRPDGSPVDHSCLTSSYDTIMLLCLAGGGEMSQPPGPAELHVQFIRQACEISLVLQFSVRYQFAPAAWRRLVLSQRGAADLHVQLLQEARRRLTPDLLRVPARSEVGMFRTSGPGTRLHMHLDMPFLPAGAGAIQVADPTSRKFTTSPRERLPI